MPDYDWSKFDVYFYIRKPIDVVFEAWSTAHGLEKFFIKRARIVSKDGQVRPGDQFMRPGDTYTWDWWFDWKSQGTILEVNPNQQISFTFGKETRVSVNLSTVDDHTQIHLVQENIPTDPASMVNIHLDCRGGWIYFLTILKGVLEFGVDVRDKQASTAESLAVYYKPEMSLRASGGA